MPRTEDLTISTQISPTLYAELQGLAEFKDCPSSLILKNIVEDYVFRAKVQKGLDDLEAGRVVSHEQVIANLRKRGIHVDYMDK